MDEVQVAFGEGNVTVRQVLQKVAADAERMGGKTTISGDVLTAEMSGPRSAALFIDKVRGRALKMIDDKEGWTIRAEVSPILVTVTREEA